MNTPMIRFNGYDEDWEKVKLGDMGETYTGLRGKTKSDFGHGEAEYVPYTNINRNTIADINLTDKTTVDESQDPVKLGDILFTMSSETFDEIGLSSVWLDNRPNVYLNSFSFGYRPNDELLNSLFMSYKLRSEVMRRVMIPLGQGISRINISRGRIMNLTSKTPKLQEQEQIGNFFKTLDELISAEEDKQILLEQYKEAMLQKMFPAKGEALPEVRFEGYDEEWEEVKLGDALDYEQPTKYLVDSDNYSDNFETPVLTAGKTFLLGYTDEVEGRYDKGDVILFDDFTTAFHYIDFPFKVKSSATKFLTPVNDDFNLRFISGSMRGIQHPTEAHKRYWISEFRTLLRYMPDIEEQEQIGNFFKVLDDKIELQQKHIEDLQDVKESFLQKMFV